MLYFLTLVLIPSLVLFLLVLSPFLEVGSSEVMTLNLNPVLGLDSSGQTYQRLAAFSDFQELLIPNSQWALFTFWHNLLFYLEHLVPTI